MFGLNQQERDFYDKALAEMEGRWMVATKRGRLSPVLDCTQGDHVVVLEGVRFPLILRSSSSVWRLCMIGEGYVHCFACQRRELWGVGDSLIHERTEVTGDCIIIYLERFEHVVITIFPTFYPCSGFFFRISSLTSSYCYLVNIFKFERKQRLPCSACFSLDSKES